MLVPPAEPAEAVAAQAGTEAGAEPVAAAEERDAFYLNSLEKRDHQTTIKIMAKSDANHDFGALEENANTALNNSMPGGAQGHIDEPSTLMNICKTSTDGIFSGANAAAKRDTMLASDSMKVFTTQELYTYAIRRSPIAANGATLFNALFPELNDVYLIIDFAHYHIMEALKKGTKDLTKTVHYLFTPEIENDPAQKPDVNKIDHTASSNGVNVRGHIQKSMKGMTDVTTYTAWDINSKSQLNLFFSNYNLHLSKLETRTILGKQKFSTTLTLVEGNNISTVHNSKQENSINNLQKYITGILRRAFQRPQSFILATKYKQKRSGDWLQVIAALTAHMKNFPTIAANAINKSNTFFMTHDQIALAFALLLGVNCIFLKDKIAYSFITTIRTEADIVDDWKTKHTSAEHRQLVGFLTAHQNFRTTNLPTFSAAIRAVRLPARGDIGEVYLPLQTMFRNAVSYCFILESFPDVSSIQSVISNEPTAETLNTYITAYNAAKQLYISHGSSSDTFNKSIIKLQNSDVYTCIENFKNQDEANKKGLKNRLFKKTEQRPQDKFIFLPYCSKLPRADKTHIIGLTEEIVSKLGNNSLIIAIQSPRFIEKINCEMKVIRDTCRLFFNEALVDSREIQNTMNDAEANAGGDEEDKVNSLAITAVIPANQVSLDERGSREGRDSDTVQDAAAGGGVFRKQKGGWRAATNIILTNDIDIQQSTRTLLYAHLLCTSFFYFVNGERLIRVAGALPQVMSGLSAAVGGAIGYLRRGLGQHLLQGWESSFEPPAEIVVDAGLGAALGYVGGVMMRNRFFAQTEIGQVYTALTAGNMLEYPANYDGDRLQHQVFIGGGTEQQISLRGIFHPLLPIYFLLDVYDECMSPKCVGSSIYTHMIKYYLILKKSAEIIQTIYKKDKVHAHIIGDTLYRALFTLTSIEAGQELLSTVFDVDIEEYKIYSYINNLVVDRGAGVGKASKDEFLLSVLLPLTNYFNDFAKELDMKSIITQDISHYTLESLKKECVEFTLQLGEQIIQDENSVEELLVVDTNTSIPLTTVSKNKKIPTNRKTIKNMIKKMINTFSPQQLEEYLQKYPEAIEIAGKEPNIMDAFLKKFPQAVEGAYDPNAEVYANAVAQEAAYAATPAMKNRGILAGMGGGGKTYKKKKTSKRKTRRARGNRR